MHAVHRERVEGEEHSYPDRVRCSSARHIVFHALIARRGMCIVGFRFRVF
jgi:hypothetical protein